MGDIPHMIVGTGATRGGSPPYASRYPQAEGSFTMICEKRGMYFNAAWAGGQYKVEQ